MNFHHAPIEDGGRVLVVHDPTKMLAPAPDLPFVACDCAWMGYAVLKSPQDFRVTAAGNIEYAPLPKVE